MTDQAKTDCRVVYGFACTYWGPIDSVGIREGLPCCPYCAGLLLEAPTERDFLRGARENEARDPGYLAFIQWMKGQPCSKTISEQRQRYADATGIKHAE